MNRTNRDHQQGMYVGRDFDPANPTESEVFSLDFVYTLQSGETINSVTSIDLTVFQGMDANPNSHLTGNPIVSGKVVSQRVGGLVAGVTYTFSITVNTSPPLSNVITLFSRIACRPVQ
jgi:hypothetical protein